MAYPTPVNSQITDGVAQSGVSVLGNAPAMAMGLIYQSAAHSMGLVFENMVMAQKQASICAQAATNQGVIQIYSASTMAAAVSTNRIARSGGNPVQDALMLLLLMRALKQ